MFIYHYYIKWNSPGEVHLNYLLHPVINAVTSKLLELMLLSE